MKYTGLASVPKNQGAISPAEKSLMTALTGQSRTLLCVA